MHSTGSKLNVPSTSTAKHKQAYCNSAKALLMPQHGADLDGGVCCTTVAVALLQVLGHRLLDIGSALVDRCENSSCPLIWADASVH
eukprot:13596-Heterococcus_DN1.PRE.1